MSHVKFWFNVKQVDKYKVYVHVFDTVEEMRDYGFKELHIKPKDYVGVHMPLDRKRYSEKANKWITAYNESHILINKQYMGTGVVSHEIAHAAMQICRDHLGKKFLMTCMSKTSTGTEVSEKEEFFCYIFGLLMSKITLKMYELKIYE
jgi:hypothetical protein